MSLHRATVINLNTRRHGYVRNASQRTSDRTLQSIFDSVFSLSLSVKCPHDIFLDFLKTSFRPIRRQAEAIRAVQSQIGCRRARGNPSHQREANTLVLGHTSVPTDRRSTRLATPVTISL